MRVCKFLAECVVGVWFPNCVYDTEGVLCTRVPISGNFRHPATSDSTFIVVAMVYKCFSKSNLSCSGC